MSGEKAFFIGVDSILAILIALMFFILVTGTINTLDFSAWSDNHLQRYSMDVLTVLEKTGYLSNAVFTSDATVLRQVISQTPPSMCFLMEVEGEEGIVLSVEKHDCLPTGRRRLTTRRSFVVVGDQTNIYTAKLYAWYKEESI